MEAGGLGSYSEVLSSLRSGGIHTFADAQTVDVKIVHVLVGDSVHTDIEAACSLRHNHTGEGAHLALGIIDLGDGNYLDSHGVGSNAVTGLNLKFLSFDG